MLPPDIVLSLIDFHKNYHEARKRLPFLIDEPDRHYSYSPVYVLHPAVTGVTNVTLALRRIEEMIGHTVPAPPEELGEAETVIDIEDTVAEQAANEKPE